jgi:hypothetical protein
MADEKSVTMPSEGEASEDEAVLVRRLFVEVIRPAMAQAGYSCEEASGGRGLAEYAGPYEEEIVFSKAGDERLIVIRIHAERDAE